MADDTDAKHVIIILRDNFHQWVENSLKVEKLTKKDRENILLAHDAFEKAFFDLLDFTSVEQTGRLGEIVARLMLYSAALGQLSPKAEIQKLILKNSEGIEKNRDLYGFRKTKAIPKIEALKEAVTKYVSEFQANDGSLSKTIYLNIWEATHRALKMPEEKIKENKKKKTLPWPNWKTVKDALTVALNNLDK